MSEMRGPRARGAAGGPLFLSSRWTGSLPHQGASLHCLSLSSSSLSLSPPTLSLSRPRSLSLVLTSLSLVPRLVRTSLSLSSSRLSLSLVLSEVSQLSLTLSSITYAIQSA